MVEWLCECIFNQVSRVLYVDVDALATESLSFW